MGYTVKKKSMVVIDNEPYLRSAGFEQFSIGVLITSLQVHSIHTEAGSLSTHHRLLRTALKIKELEYKPQDIISLSVQLPLAVMHCHLR